MSHSANNPIKSRPAWKNNLWYSLNDHFTYIFGEKAAKVTLSGGFSCPTRDGTKAWGGCAFCDEHGSGSLSSIERASQEIGIRIDEAIPQLSQSFKVKKFIAYFQSFTNTYAPIDSLKKLYDAAIFHEQISGLSVGTRADSVSDEALDLLDDYGKCNGKCNSNGKAKYVSIELGLQSFNNDILSFYERKETIEEILATIERALKRKNLTVTVHLMFGAPMELEGGAEKLPELMAEAALKINHLGIHGVKIHQLMVLKNTILEKRHALEPFPFVELDAYNRGVMAFLENLNPGIFVERTHALSQHDGALIGPLWSDNRLLMLNSLNALMRSEGAHQGKNFGGCTIPDAPL